MSTAMTEAAAVAEPPGLRAEPPLWTGPAREPVRMASVLLVDDTPDTLLLLETILRPLEQRLVSVASGEEALKCLRETDFAVILLDVRMPGMSGFELAQLIKQETRNRDTPIIFLTASSQTSDHLFRGYSAGAVDFMFKPFDPLALRSKVSVFVELHLAKRELEGQRGQLELALSELEEIAVANAQLAAIVEHSDDAIIAHDLDGSILNWNAGAETIFGHDADEVIGQPISILAPPDHPDEVPELLARIRRGERVDHSEMVWIRRDGRRIDVSVTLSPIRDSSGEITGISVVARDITEHKRAEELEALAEHLARSNRELQDFASVASHDLQEPLRKIQTFGDRLAQKCAESLGEEGADYLVRMQGAAARMQRLIEDLLKFSRLTATTDPPRPVDLNTVARAAVSNLSTRIEETAGVVQLGPLPVVQGDASQMQQLLQNLIGNSLKFHRADVAPVVKVYEEPADQLRDPRAGRFCRVIVEDNGIGFGAKYSERIFTVFQRLHSRDEYEGTGIGLALCRKIAERHGGRISATSTPGEGSRFVVTLRVGRMDEESRRAPQGC